ncbi:MAG: hypothetical protein JWL71_2162 [Acidobacteria bacterium]|nr:hypothetical protein [Acidobacteriota bacterium]
MNNVRTIFLNALLLAASLLSGAAPQPRTAGFSRFDPASHVDRQTALPPGFAASVDRTIRDQFVRVAAGDVDRDGDIDVVASLGTLDLVIWKNDGAGHFTRVAASQHDAFQRQPAAPAVDGHSFGSDEWIQTDPPRDAALASLRARAVADPRLAFAPVVRLAAGSDGPRRRSSRAPPIT